MLSNAYFLAKFRFDTAENEPAKNVQKTNRQLNLANLPKSGHQSRRRGGLPVELLQHGGGLGHRRLRLLGILDRLLVVRLLLLAREGRLAALVRG